MSNNGIKTSFWGPHAWAFLFSVIAGSYPVRVDTHNKEHMKIVKSIQSLMKSLTYALPCGFCKCSFKQYLKELPFDDYERSRLGMMKWMYLIHDKVNKKLIKQERERYDIEKQKLISKRLSTDQLKKAVDVLKSTILKTKQSPPFERVVAMYEKQRA